MAHVIETSKTEIVQASKMVACGAPVEQRMLHLADHLRDLMKLPAGGRRAGAQGDGSDDLKSLGQMAWPRPLERVLHTSLNEAKIAELMTRLAWRLCDHVAIIITGKVACQTAVPMIDDVWPFPKLGYSN